MADDAIWSKEFIRLATVDEAPEDSMLAVSTFYWEVAIIRWKGKYYAFNRSCPHIGGEIVQQGVLSEPDVHCNSHGYHYDFRTGESTWPAGEEPLQMFPVRVSGDYIEVELPVVSIRLPSVPSGRDVA